MVHEQTRRPKRGVGSDLDPAHAAASGARPAPNGPDAAMVVFTYAETRA